jgi:hypothetical protein
MLLSLVYFVLRRLLQAPAPSDRSDLELGAELLVLRHQVKGPLQERSLAAVPQARSDGAGRGELDPAERAVDGVRGDPSDPAPVAPGARPSQVDVPTPQTGQAAARSRDGGAHRAKWGGRIPGGAT